MHLFLRINKKPLVFFKQIREVDAFYMESELAVPMWMCIHPYGNRVHFPLKSFQGLKQPGRFHAEFKAESNSHAGFAS